MFLASSAGAFSRLWVRKRMTMGEEKEEEKKRKRRERRRSRRRRRKRRKREVEGGGGGVEGRRVFVCWLVA